MKSLNVGDILFTKSETEEIRNDIMFVYINREKLLQYQYYKQRYKVVKINVASRYNTIAVTNKQASESWTQRIQEFFEWHNYDFRVIRLYINSFINDTEFFDELPKLIPHLNPLSSTEYLNRFHELLLNVQPGDALFLFNPKSITSKVITYFTHGPWSHCATVYRNLTLADMRPSGLLELPIEYYFYKGYRMGLYRTKNQLTSEQKFQLLKYVHQSLNSPSPKFGFMSSLIAGYHNWKGYINEKYPTPMDLVYSGNLRLVHTV